ncbi:MAG: prenyltransferase/squalene oxidase repeat-containing protein, partial [Planctomycetota bacterium]
GSFPGRGTYSVNVEKGLNFILNCIDENGYVTYGESRMYSHAFATLFLAEIYGMSRRKDVGEKLRLAVEAIVRAQNKHGGWRYKPDSQDSDMSITVCQIMALRAARNCGIAVPFGTIKKAIDYVKNSSASNGRFYYQIYNEDGLGGKERSRTSLALTAAGVAALQGAGEYNSQEVKAGLRRMFEEFVVADTPLGIDRSENWIEAGRQSFDYFYCHYYGIQAMFQADSSYWNPWWSKICSQLLRLQYSDGRWEDLVGPNYATAMATLILQIPLQYLPIFQK